MWSMRFHYVSQKLLTYTPKYHASTKIRGALWKGTCDKCKFQTTRKWVLKRHISKVKQYEWYDLCDSTKFCKSYLHVHLNTMHLSIQQKCTHRKFSPTNNITKISITSSQSQLMIRNLCEFNKKIGNEKISDREDNEMENIRSDWKWKKKS